MLLLIAVCCLCVFAFAAPAAEAAFELAGPFGASGEGEIGEAAAGAAIDYASGDIYVADGLNRRVTRFNAEGGFLEAWGWGVANGADEFQTCGPEGAVPLCEFDLNGRRGLRGEGAGQFEWADGVAVDQATGDVYVLDRERKNGVVQVFSSDGAQLIASFGELGEGPVSASPGRLHGVGIVGGIAVDSSGDVYLSDGANTDAPETRVMVLKPETPGDYAHYVYAGQSHDFAVGDTPEALAVDSSADVYFVGGEEHVYKFAAGIFTAPAWSFEDNTGITSLAVDPTTGDSFVYTYATKRFHELDAAGVQIAEFPGVKGEGAFTNGLAFNPGAVLGAEHAAGVLYATDGVALTGLIFAQPPVVPPVVDGESVANIGTGSAVLKALVDPKGFDIRYRFEYGTGDCAAGECVEAPVGGGDLGAGQGDHAASVTVSGLTPGGTYHFRVTVVSHCNVAEPAVECLVEGSERTFTTFSSVPGLPDGRVYELVSPPFKNGGEVFPADPRGSSEAMPGAQDTGMPMQSAPDGNAVVYEGDPFYAKSGAPSENEYLARRTAGGWETRDLSPAFRERDVAGRQGFKSFSGDLSSSVLLATLQQFSPEAPVGYKDLYVQDSAAPEGLRPLVAFEPPNQPAGSFAPVFAGASSDLSHVIFSANDALTPASGVAPAAEYDGGAGNLYEWVGGALRLVNVLPGNTETLPGAAFGPEFGHPISADGSRVFWSAGGHVYVREDGATTVEVPDPAAGGILDASVDGSRVLLGDAMLYDLGTGTLSDLTGGQGGFLGLLGASEDLSSVYFRDSAVLSGEERNSEGQKANAGDSNLYLWRDGAVRFLADPGGAPGTSEVTSDGRYLAFVSTASLTGYDNNNATEVYQYDANSERLVCASCNPTGERPLGASKLSVIYPGFASLPQPLNLSSDGRVFFDSEDVLSPQDTNGRVDDVYEYEPGGVGSCAGPAGCIFLISSGSGTADSNFVAASPSGSDVFFTTRSQLVGEDQDDLMDLYDARVGGGFPPGPSSPPCSSEACRSSLPGPSVFAPLATLSLTGSGNLQAPPSPRVVKPRSLTRAQKLARALKACAKQRPKRKRSVCEAHARRQYGTKTKARAGRAVKSAAGRPQASSNHGRGK
jgi:hypothetical protein